MNDRPALTSPILVRVLVALGLAAFLMTGCDSDGDSGTSGSSTATATSPPIATTPGATTSGEAFPTQPSTGAIRPAGPTATSTPQAIDYEAFLTQRDLVLGEPPVEADVTGDGRPEALLNAHAPDCASCHARTFFVLRGADVLFEGGGAGWMTPLADLADKDGFQWFSPLAIPGEPLCCPSWFAVETYVWAGSAFVLQEAVELQHFQEVNDMPMEPPLEPPIQVATVVLYYTQVDREHFAHAYALLSGSFQDANPYDAWAAGFSATDSVHIQAVSTGSSANEINVRFEATDTTAGGTSTTVFDGEWTLVEEAGGWKLDSASIVVVP